MFIFQESDTLHERATTPLPIRNVLSTFVIFQSVQLLRCLMKYQKTVYPCEYIEMSFVVFSFFQVGFPFHIFLNRVITIALKQVPFGNC